MKHRLNLTINRKSLTIEAEPEKTLLQVLRELDLTGAKEACGIGECGACTVLVDNQPVYSCLMLAVEADGKDILTIEGLGQPKQAAPLAGSFQGIRSYSVRLLHAWYVALRPRTAFAEPCPFGFGNPECHSR